MHWFNPTYLWTYSSKNDVCHGPSCRWSYGLSWFLGLDDVPCCTRLHVYLFPTKVFIQSSWIQYCQRMPWSPLLSSSNQGPRMARPCRALSRNYDSCSCQRHLIGWRSGNRERSNWNSNYVRHDLVPSHWVFLQLATSPFHILVHALLDLGISHVNEVRP
jgi:hypothetical protein